MLGCKTLTIATLALQPLQPDALTVLPRVPPALNACCPLNVKHQSSPCPSPCGRMPQRGHQPITVLFIPYSLPPPLTLCANATRKLTAASRRAGDASSAHLAAGGSRMGASFDRAGLASALTSPASHARESSLTLGFAWLMAAALIPNKHGMQREDGISVSSRVFEQDPAPCSALRPVVLLANLCAGQPVHPSTKLSSTLSSSQQHEAMPCLKALFRSLLFLNAFKHCLQGAERL